MYLSNILTLFTKGNDERHEVVWPDALRHGRDHNHPQAISERREQQKDEVQCMVFTVTIDEPEKIVIFPPDNWQGDEGSSQEHAIKLPYDRLRVVGRLH